MDRRILKTKRNIRESLMDLMKTKTVSQITITELTDHADIGRKTFYLHYTSLDDVLKEIEEEMTSTFFKYLDEYTNNGKAYDITEIFKDLNNLILSKESFLRSIAMNDSYSFFEHIFENILKAAVERICKEIYHISSLNIDLYVSFYVSGIISTYFRWLRGDIDTTLDNLTRVLSRSVFIGANKMIEEL